MPSSDLLKRGVDCLRPDDPLLTFERNMRRQGFGRKIGIDLIQRIRHSEPRLQTGRVIPGALHRFEHADIDPLFLQETPQAQRGHGLADIGPRPGDKKIADLPAEINLHRRVPSSQITQNVAVTPKRSVKCRR